MADTAFPLATASWDEKEYAAIQRVIASGHFSMGPEVAQFERDFAEMIGSKYAVMVNSGSSANLLMTAALTSPTTSSSTETKVCSLAASTCTTYFVAETVLVRGQLLLYVQKP